jgi:exopolysaccharide/PEP-CTERM locus tyrosine autokinase
MSRIEQALEKAASLRNTIATTPEKRDVEGNAVVQPIRQHIPPPPIGANEIMVKTENPFLATLSDPHSPVSEEYRKLKSVLSAYVRGDKFRNVIMVTSSVSGEGKSLTSLNLAITLAQELDHTVLLVDADLRKPSIEEYLGEKHSKGLSDHLTEGIPLSDLLVKTGIGRLTLLPAGKSMKNPVELFSSQKMKDFISEIKNRYPDRFIIIDTPPVLPFAESRSLSTIVDGVIFVIREGRTTPDNIAEAMKSLDAKKLVGSVFNAATQASLNGRYHSYYYGYGYDKQETEDSGLKSTNRKQRTKDSGKGQGDAGFIKRFFSR